MGPLLLRWRQQREQRVQQRGGHTQQRPLLSLLLLVVVLLLAPIASSFAFTPPIQHHTPGRGTRRAAIGRVRVVDASPRRRLPLWPLQSAVEGGDNGGGGDNKQASARKAAAAGAAASAGGKGKGGGGGGGVDRRGAVGRHGGALLMALGKYLCMGAGVF